MNVSTQSYIYLVVCTLFAAIHAQPNDEYVTIAILAKDKAHTLAYYLKCIENQTWPKERTYLYIRTNNNNDNTAEILRNWITKVDTQYAHIYFDDTDVTENIEIFKQHEWNGTRFKVLGRIRQDSVDWAYRHNSHYFVADCDNFILPETIENLVATQKPIVAPFLVCHDKGFYSNYHFAIDKNGYYAQSPLYFNIYKREVMGIIDVPVVHCTYLVRHEFLDKISYDDDSWRYEYVIFSDTARKQNIQQSLDNRKVYGYISFAETEQEFDQEKPAFDNFFSINSVTIADEEPVLILLRYPE